MQTSSLLFQLGLALAIGLLVGTERHWHDRDDAPGARTAGIRTFGIIGLLGGITGTIAEAHSLSSAVLIGAVFIAFSIVFGLFKWREEREQHGYSVTTVVAAQVTLLLGVLAALDEPAVAAGGAIALTLVLASRDYLHAFVQRLTWSELRSAIFLLAMALIVLPLLPDRPVGPYNAINPSEIWIFTIILAGVSYAGYIAVRVFGDTHGPLIAGIAGGLASSTAVALTAARDSVSTPENIRSIAAGALAASAISVVRGILLVLLFAPSARQILLPALGIMALVMCISAFACMLKAITGSSTIISGKVEHKARNPFELSSVLQLSAIIAIATIATRAAAAYFGDQGILAAVTIMGLVDIDSTILAITRLSTETVPPSIQEVAIILAISSNILAKMIYSIALGSRLYGIMISIVSLLSLAAGTLVALAMLV